MLYICGDLTIKPGHQVPGSLLPVESDDVYSADNVSMLLMLRMHSLRITVPVVWYAYAITLTASQDKVSSMTFQHSSADYLHGQMDHVSSKL